MAVTKRSDKGAALTHAEMDANWDELLAVMAALNILNGNISIGTAESSTARLRVRLTSTTNPIAQFDYNATSPVLRIRMDGNGNTILDAPGGGVTSKTFCFYTEGLERMRIAPNTGNLIIGTLTDNGTGAKLQVQGDISLNTGTLLFSDTQSAASASAGGGAALPATVAGFLFVKIGANWRKIPYYAS